MKFVFAVINVRLREDFQKPTHFLKRGVSTKTRQERNKISLFTVTFLQFTSESAGHGDAGKQTAAVLVTGSTEQHIPPSNLGPRYRSKLPPLHHQHRPIPHTLPFFPSYKVSTHLT